MTSSAMLVDLIIYGLRTRQLAEVHEVGNIYNSKYSMYIHDMNWYGDNNIPVWMDKKANM